MRRRGRAVRAATSSRGRILLRTLIFSVLFSAAAASAEDPARGAIASPLLDLAERVSAEHHGSPGARDGHYASSVEYAYDALLLRVHLIRAARRSIDVQTFIWAGDESSDLLAYELVQAARRGVKVRILVDSMGTEGAARRIGFNESTYPNIEIKIYRPAARRLNPGAPRRVISFLLPLGANQRMHNKLMLVDGVLGITGGRNVGNEYFGLATGYNFKDRDVIVAGPQAAEMARSFEAYWEFRRSYFNYHLKDVAALVKRGLTRPELTREGARLDTMFAAADHDANDAGIIQRAFVDTMMPVDSLEFVADAPGRKTRFAYTNIETKSRVADSFWAALEDAREELLMQTPYTIFDLRARHQFRKHSRQAPELRVRISTNSLAAADHTVTYAANYRLRTTVVNGLHFEVYEMKPHPEMLGEHLPRFEELKQRARDAGQATDPYLSIHAKTYVFDGRTAYIGTLNFDPRSIYVNSECGVFIEDANFASALRDTLLRDMSAPNSWVIARNRYWLGFVNGPIEAVSAALPINPWPLQNTSSYQLKPGAAEVPPHDPKFYENYEDVGRFPETNGLEPRRIMTSIYKTFGMATTPLL